MAKLQLKGEWKLWAGFAAIFILAAFYLYMVSRPPMEGGEYLWRVDKIISSKEFSLRSLGNVIRFRLIGLACAAIPRTAGKDLPDLFFGKSMGSD